MMMNKFVVSILMGMCSISICMAQSKEDETIRKNEIPYGPILKFEPTAIAHNYSKIMFGVEYFINSKLSLQHEIGPVVSIENYVLFEDQNKYEKFYGGALNNEIRYQVYNNKDNLDALKKRGIDRTLKSLYLALELNYNQTHIDSYVSAGFDCDASNLCTYYQKTDAIYIRRWLGLGVKAGFQFVFSNNLSLDMNSGIGVRRLWVEDNYTLPPEAVLSYSGINFTYNEYLPYFNLCFLIGYCLGN